MANISSALIFVVHEASCSRDDNANVKNPEKNLMSYMDGP